MSETEPMEAKPEAPAKQPAPTPTKMKVPSGPFNLTVIDDAGKEICKAKVSGPIQVDVIIASEGE